MTSRVKNPAAALTAAYVAGIVTAAGSVYATMAAPARTLRREGDPLYLDDGPTALVFMQAPGSAHWTIDKATGGGGFGHVAVLPALKGEDGSPVLFDAYASRSAGFLWASKYADLPAAAVYFDESWSAYVQGACFGAEGRPYKFQAAGAHCVEIALQCSPPFFRERVVRELGTARLSPNAVANILGLTVGDLTVDDILKRK